MGTSSLRRQSQLLAVRPDLEVAFLRGNVNTRLAKLDAGEYDAIILAAAGLKRLGFVDKIASYISPEAILPAGGQGAVGIEYRVNDSELLERLQVLHHQPTAVRVTAERAMNKRLEGGCQVPIGCFAELNEKGGLWLRGLVADPYGHQIIVDELSGKPEDAESMGIELAERLLRAGAGDILSAIYNKA